MIIFLITNTQLLYLQGYCGAFISCLNSTPSVAINITINNYLILHEHIVIIFKTCLHKHKNVQGQNLRIKHSIHHALQEMCKSVVCMSLPVLLH